MTCELPLVGSTLFEQHPEWNKTDGTLLVVSLIKWSTSLIGVQWRGPHIPP